MHVATPISLPGAVVAITGGARGIGAATAAAFANAGARVAIGDLDVVAARDTANGFGGTAHHLDVADRASMQSFIDDVTDQLGPVDILVNNAGIMPNGAFLDLDEAMDRLTMDVNVFGVMNGMRAVLPGMVERRRGHVVNIASLAGKFPLPGLAVYNASKFAVVGLTAATRLELAGTGVSMTTILPSAVDTALASGLDMRPIPKVTPEEIAAAVVDSVRTRSGEVAVPRWVGGMATVANVLPAGVLDRVRRLARDDRALVDDHPDRLAYRDALAKQQADQR